MITAVFGGAHAMVIAALGLRVSLWRIRSRKVKGLLDDPAFARLQRAHGNAVEHTPLLLFLMLLLELQGFGRAVVVAVGCAILVARLMHAAGITRRWRHPLHFYGAALTYTLEATLGALAAWRGVEVLVK